MAAVASARTPYSSPSWSELIEWFEFHRLLVQDALNAAQTCRAVFIGDSITESVRGTSYGKTCMRCNHIPEVFREEFGDLAPLVLAISGDMTQHVLWRLDNGEVPKQLHPEVHMALQLRLTLIDALQVAVVMIGINNLLRGYGVEETFSGIQAVIERLKQQRPLMHIVTVGLLPIADRGRDTEQARQDVNRRLREYVEIEHPDDKVHYIDCSQSFVVADGLIGQGLMPDGVHPSANGMTKWAECIKPLVQQLINL